MRDDERDPGEQRDPWEVDPTETVLEDPIAGVETSDEWKNPEPLQDCPVLDPRAALWQEHTFWRPNPEEVSWTSDMCIELARFACPPGNQGRVHVLETSILGCTSVPARCNNNADKFPYDYAVQLGGPVDCCEHPLAFYLRLESWKRLGLVGNPRDVATRYQLPGIPHPSLGEWHDGRYDYARRKDTALFVPEGLYLTLWVELVTKDLSDLRALWGRLGGFTQTYRDNPQAIDEARRWRQL